MQIAWTGRKMKQTRMNRQINEPNQNEPVETSELKWVGLAGLTHSRFGLDLAQTKTRIALSQIGDKENL